MEKWFRATWAWITVGEQTHCWVWPCRTVTGDIDYEETETGAGELETTMRSVYPYAYWSPRPGLGLWGVLGYGFGETALTDTAVSNLETDVEMWMAALGGRSELFRLGRVDLAVKADAYSVCGWNRTRWEALESTRVDSGRLRLALEGRTSLAYCLSIPG